MNTLDKVIEIKCKAHIELNYKDLIPTQGDLKTLSTEDFNKLKKNIVEDGFSAPPFVWQDESGYHLLDGHQRQRVLGILEGEGYLIPKIPCALIEADSLDHAKKKLLMFVSQFGQVSQESLFEYAQLNSIDIEWMMDRLTIPESMIDFNSMMDNFGPENEGECDEDECDEDEVPELRQDDRIKLGDLIEFGNHKLMCGSTTSAEDMAKLMGDATADLVWTDPPYNVNYESKSIKGMKIQNDNMDDQAFFSFLLDSFTNLKAHTRDGGAIYIAHADSEGMNFRKAMVEGGWLLKQCLIWVKNSLVMGRQDYHWKHEPILYGWAPGAAHTWEADRSQTTVLEFNKPSKNDIHPTMKPVDLIEYCLNNSSKRHANVLDGFGGSGSTMIACEKTGRSSFSMELDENYCSVIVTRWCKFTGNNKIRINGAETEWDITPTASTSTQTEASHISV